ncbi:MAG: threonine--tRNA ligase [Nitrospinae bacterium]|nr:threonine--tRNA ligase [Nitrospinota bacterium]
MEITLTLKDGQEIRCPRGSSLKEVISPLQGSPDGMVISAKLDGILVDLSHPVDRDARVELVTFDSPEGKQVYRHSSAHLMAQAVKELFPEAKLAIGPAIEEGFYYDFEVDRPFSPEDLERIEERMAGIVQRDLPIQRIEVSKEEARRIFQDRGEPYKLELIDEIPEERMTLYRQGEFIDLCRGPHVASTRQIVAFKLLNIAGAYWRGDERNKMLQRIYGTSYPTSDELEHYLHWLEEVKKRDHRRLGKELDLFSIQEEAGPGLVIYHPKGALIRTVIEDFWRREHYKAGYEIVYAPHIGRMNLWGISGHLDFYRENMYSPMDIEGQQYFIKPMNCPYHILIYRSRMRSYRELPLRWAELGTVYRYERSGVLHGLLRVRGFTIDDAHIFCRPDQMEEEIRGVMEFSLRVLRTFGFQEFEVYLSTRPEKFVGKAENWEQATEALRRSIEAEGLSYQVDEGGGAFYGPKIDVKIKDALGRAWQCTTIQFDFNLPERFDLVYVGEDGREHRPYMVHRAVLGSLERFLGALIEHYGGAFPLWLAPVQLKIIPIADRHLEYGEKLVRRLRELDIRAEVDARSERMGYKIREAQLAKIPYMAVVGDKEVTSDTVSLRTRQGNDLGPIRMEDLIDRILREVQQKE